MVSNTSPKCPPVPQALMMNWVKSRIQLGDPDGLWQLLGRRLATLRPTWQLEGQLLAGDLASRFDAICRLHGRLRPWSQASSHVLFSEWVGWSEQLSGVWPVTTADQWLEVIQLEQNRIVQSILILSASARMMAGAAPGTERLAGLSQRELEFWNALPLPPGPQGVETPDSYLHRGADPMAFEQLRKLARVIGALTEHVAESVNAGGTSSRPRALTAGVVRQVGNAISCLEHGCPVPDHQLLRPLEALLLAVNDAAGTAEIQEYAVAASELLPALRIAGPPERHDDRADDEPGPTPLAPPQERLALAARKLQDSDSQELQTLAARILAVVDDAARRELPSEFLDCLLLVDDLVCADTRPRIDGLLSARDALREVLFPVANTGPYRILADDLRGSPRCDYANQVDALPGVVPSTRFPPDTIIEVRRPGYLFQSNTAPPVVIRKAVVRVTG